MKHLFSDLNKDVFVKVLQSTEAAEREVMGAKALAEFVVTPEVVRLDTKTVKITTIKGIAVNRIAPGLLTDMVKSYLESLRQIDGDERLGMRSKLWTMRQVLGGVVVEPLSEQIDMELGRRMSFPIHGDLQKQNMFVVGGKLALIDFEHFCFGPLELELVNSLFFQDHNCLPMDKIIPELLRKDRISISGVELMLYYYALRQIMMGRPVANAIARVRRGKKLLHGYKVVIAEKSDRWEHQLMSIRPRKGTNEFPSCRDFG